MESTLEAIVVEDNEELLKSIESDFSVEDGEITSHGNSVPIMKYAIKKSSLKCVRVFLEMGVETSEEDGRSPLHIAAQVANKEVCRLLLSHKVEHDQVNKVDNKGNTALHLCAQSQNEEALECMKMLLDKGADIEVKNFKGLSPLHVAASGKEISSKKEIMI